MTIDLAKLHNLAEAGQRLRSKSASQDKAGKRWYNIKNSAGKAEVYLYDMIGDWGVTAQDFVDELRQVDADVIDLYINSEGGEVFDGIAIYEGIKGHKAYVTTKVTGLAASAASFIAMAGDRVEMGKHGRMMIHDAAIGGVYGVGNPSDLREFADEVLKLADILDDLSDNIASMYAEKAGGTTASWRALMTATTWFSAQAAKDKGLIDGIIGEEDDAGDASTDGNNSTPAQQDKAETTNAVDFSNFFNEMKGLFA